MKMHSHSRLHLGLGLAVFFMLLAAGCGRKGPPVPPRREKPPAVRDLRYTLQGDVVALTWKIPRDKREHPTRLAGFKIYAARVPLSESGCKNCPLPYIQVGDIVLGMTRSAEIKNKSISFSQTLTPGYRYVYRIITFDADGLLSDQSNRVDFVYGQPAP